MVICYDTFDCIENNICRERIRVDGTKKPLLFRGLAFLLIPLILRKAPPELAPFLRGADGLPGFIGPFPSTSLDESDITHDSFVCVLTRHKHCLALYIFYAKDRLIVNHKSVRIENLHAVPPNNTRFSVAWQAR